MPLTYGDIIDAKEELHENGCAPDRITVDETAAETLMEDSEMPTVTHALANDDDSLLDVVGIEVNIVDDGAIEGQTGAAVVVDTSVPRSDPRGHVVVRPSNGGS